MDLGSFPPPREASSDTSEEPGKEGKAKTCLHEDCFDGDDVTKALGHGIVIASKLYQRFEHEAP